MSSDKPNPTGYRTDNRDISVDGRRPRRQVREALCHRRFPTTNRHFKNAILSALKEASPSPQAGAARERYLKSAAYQITVVLLATGTGKAAAGEVGRGQTIIVHGLSEPRITSRCYGTTVIGDWCYRIRCFVLRAWVILDCTARQLLSARSWCLRVEIHPCWCQTYGSSGTWAGNDLAVLDLSPAESKHGPR